MKFLADWILEISGVQIIDRQHYFKPPFLKIAPKIVLCYQIELSIIFCIISNDFDYSRIFKSFLSTNSVFYLVYNYLVQMNQNCHGDNMTKMDVRIRQMSESMILVAGSISGFWIWNKKTFLNWKNVFSCNFTCSKQQTYPVKYNEETIALSRTATINRRKENSRLVQNHFPVWNVFYFIIIICT